MWSAALWGGDAAVVSGATAAALWRVPGLGRGRVELTHPTKRARHGVVVHRARLGPADVTVLDGLRVTTAARTLTDLAARLEPPAFDAAFHYCLHSRLADVPTLAGLSERYAGPGHPGAALLRNAIAAYSGVAPAASPLEARCARLLDRSNLPPPKRQHEVVAAGRRRFLDFAWPEARVALEVDGYRWHSSLGSWESDRARIRDLRRAGWTVVSVTHEDLTRGFGAVTAEIAALLARCVPDSVTKRTMSVG